MRRGSVGGNYGGSSGGLRCIPSSVLIWNFATEAKALVVGTESTKWDEAGGIEDDFFTS